MQIKLPKNIVVLVDNEPLEVVVSPYSAGSCKGCALIDKDCGMLCGYQNVIFVKTDKPFIEDIDND